MIRREAHENLENFAWTWMERKLTLILYPVIQLNLYVVKSLIFYAGKSSQVMALNYIICLLV
jgi:hypothetical protein